MAKHLKQQCYFLRLLILFVIFAPKINKLLLIKIEVLDRI